MSIARAQTWKGKARRQALVQGVAAAAVAVVLVLLAQAYVFRIVPVESRSMAPTLLPGDYVLVNRLDYDLHAPRRGDLILFHYPQASEELFLKRVIGEPGDTIAERYGEFWVNGAPLAGPAAQAQPSTGAVRPGMRAQVVPPGEFFVLGDNPGGSLDSRFWGPVGIHDVIGRAVYICWSQHGHWWDIQWNRIGRRLR